MFYDNRLFADKNFLVIFNFLCPKILFRKNIKIIKLKAVCGENFVGKFVTHELCIFLKEVQNSFSFPFANVFKGKNSNLIRGTINFLKTKQFQAEVAQHFRK